MVSFNPQMLSLPAFNEAQVLTILAELSSKTEELKEQMRNARKQAESTKAELNNILNRIDQLRASIIQNQRDIQNLSEQISASNDQIMSLHQELAILKQQSEELRQEIAKAGRNAAVSKMKRERARLNVRIEDKETELGTLKPQVENSHRQLTALEEEMDNNNHRFRAAQKELDNLQALLPSPYLYTELYAASTQEAHANFYLDHDISRWEQAVKNSFLIIHDLHSDIRAGKYRLDRYSDLIGGRSQASVEALYSAVLLGGSDKALIFFNITSDPALYFHNILNIMLCWLMGFYLRKDLTNLRELLRYYQHSDGMRRAYVEAWLGILDHNQQLFDRAIRFIVRFEYQSAKAAGTPQLISICGLTLAYLAIKHGLTCDIKVQTIPQAILNSAVNRSVSA